MNISHKQAFELDQKNAISEKREAIPFFAPGYTILVRYKSANNMIQKFEGVVLRKKKSDNNFAASFLVRKVEKGFGVERSFCYYSPDIVSIKVIKKGVVRRAKIYYIRKLKGKKAKIPTLKRK